jgi:hypothetical protein
MTRTRPGSLILLALVGAVGGFLAELGLAASGGAIVVPPLTLPLTLAVVGVVVLGFAIPIYRATRGSKPARIDPFRSMRVAVLAKAGSLAGALFAGAGAGILLYLLSRSVIPALDSVWLAVASLAGAVVLLVCALVAEHMCTIPPADDDTAVPGHGA